MTTKEVEKILEKYNKDVKRHLDVLKEDSDSKIALIGEQYSSIKETLGEHTRILDEHTEMIGAIKEDIETIKENVEISQGDIEIIKGDMEIVKNSLKIKVDLEDFELLEKRVRILESKIR